MIQFYINIPPKPISNFYAKDSIVCRYTGLQFYNYSHAQDTLINEYLWSFGDGNTSTTINPAYIYSKPGVYTVSLFYRNGYCDSTLVKNQYIKVVDAPKPGFNVLFKQGCAPFTAQFTDTTTLNVQQKEYYFSDTKQWQNIPINQPNFNHTFTKPSVYKALQKLTGFSGCVIMQDSVTFNISKGLTKSDTVHVINSTVIDKNALIYWKTIDGAVKYQVYKNASPYKIVSDTFFNEITPYLQDASYTVAGIDSCGNLCSHGRQGKPVFLQGIMIGNNEAAAITFSPYLQWNGNNLEYKIQKLINGNWTTLNNQSMNNDYTDLNFLIHNNLQSCYRIETSELNHRNIISHSNEICIPYIPTIFYS
jgi:PKD repeat protein